MAALEKDLLNCYDHTVLNGYFITFRLCFQEKEKKEKSHFHDVELLNCSFPATFPPNGPH